MKINAIDLFCGAGGTSTGLEIACNSRGVELDLTAINHWTTAINTHSKNHPKAHHLCEPIELLKPREVCKEHLHILIASPECTHHSNARGGKPINDQSRATAFRVLEWAEALLPDFVLIENVPEFCSWGPVDARGKRIKECSGEIFSQYIQMFRSIGYAVDFRVLNAADYGDPTTRRRLFIIAQRNAHCIKWPSPTHADPRKKSNALINDLAPWVPAKDVIDWSMPSESIFDRRKPLARKTLQRVFAGIEKYCGEAASPFLYILERYMAGDIVGPYPIVIEGDIDLTKCQSFILPHLKFKSDGADSINQPLRTIDATNGRAFKIATPVIFPHFGERQAQSPRCHSINAPLPTVTSRGGGSFVEPVIVDLAHGNGNEDPALAAMRRSRSINEPVATITGSDAQALVTPFIINTPSGSLGIDIQMRLLSPRELASAMSFPDDYEFVGSKEAQVRQIGNAVPVGIARALVDSILRQITQAASSLEAA